MGRMADPPKADAEPSTAHHSSTHPERKAKGFAHYALSKVEGHIQRKAQNAKRKA
jgi:hypothetical protein